MKSPACNVLVVDDDPAMRDSLREVLEDENHSVLLASDGREGLELLRENPDIQVVLLDVMMPVMNGLELLAVKMRDERIAAVPVVLMTAHHQHTQKVVGAASIFAKPFRTQALLEEVRRLCDCDRVKRRGGGARSPRATAGIPAGSASSRARASGS